MHRDGMFTEGAATNAFFVVKGVLRTYPVSNYILQGITRIEIVKLIHELGLPFDERPVALSELGACEEIFVCGTTTDVQPLVEVDGRPVGNGKPGPLTVQLKEAFAKRLYAK
jgi:D-alanine transaminase